MNDLSLMHMTSLTLLPGPPGTLIVLRAPYPWRVEEPSIYESVRVHTAIQTGRTESDLVADAPSVGHYKPDLLGVRQYRDRSLRSR